MSARARSSPSPSHAARPAATVDAHGRNGDMGEVLVHFRTVVRAIRRHYQRVEQACGISGAQLWALAQLAEAPGLRVGELAQALAIHQSTASNLLDKLESAGLVSRRRSDEDLRVVRLHLTARGRRVLARAPRPLRGVLQQGLLDLPDASLRTLNRELATLVRCMHLRERSARKVLLEEDLRPPPR
jgi:DNA-binding MarR family transcriptional regulator